MKKASVQCSNSGAIIFCRLPARAVIKASSVPCTNKALKFSRLALSHRLPSMATVNSVDRRRPRARPRFEACHSPTTALRSVSTRQRHTGSRPRMPAALTVGTFRAVLAAVRTVHSRCPLVKRVSRTCAIRRMRRCAPTARPLRVVRSTRQNTDESSRRRMAGETCRRADATPGFRPSAAEAAVHAETPGCATAGHLPTSRARRLGRRAVVTQPRISPPLPGN